MRARQCAWLLCVTFLLAACSDRGQEMEEKITQMQRQLDQTQKQLQAANQALASRPQTDATQTSVASSGGLPSREAVEQSYSTSVNAFRKELETNLKNFRLESCTTHSVQMPTEFYPFTSQLSLALVSTDGKNFTTDIPVKADVTGKWIFPSVAEVTQRIANAQRVATTDTSSRGTAQKQQQQSTSTQPAPYMKVDGTFVIQWPDSGAHTPAVAARTPAPVENTPAPVASASPPPRPQPSAQSGAQPVMPVDRDVHIQFPSPP
jgi:hypothetical protein